MFSDKTETIANAANMLVNVAAFYIAPTGITAIGAAANSLLSLQAIFKAPNAAKQLTDQTAKCLRDALTQPAFTNDQCQLLPQMLEAALPAPSDFAQKNLNPDAILALMTARLTDFEHQKSENTQAFTNWLRPALIALLNNADFVTTFAPQIAAETLARLQNIATGIQGLHQKTDDLTTAVAAIDRKLDEAPNAAKTFAAALTEINAANRDALNDLAVEFLIDTPAKYSDAHLRQLLIYKAQEFKALTESVANLLGKSERLDNILPQIEAAIADRAYTRARQLIEDAREIRRDLLRAELETDANLLETAARIDLYENQSDAAYRKFADAANSFAAVDRAAVITRRNTYAHSLYNHGQRYGGSGLPRAINLLQSNVNDLSQTDQPLDWAQAQNNLAVALRNQAARTEGDEGARLLAEAIAAYRNALKVYSRKDHPVNWAKTQNNLANALCNQAARTEGNPGARLLAEAVAAYRNALKVRTRKDHPVNWAATQNGLAIALRNQAARTEGDVGARLLSEAIAAYRNALKVYTRKDHPVGWAMTQNNLAVALGNQAARTEGDAGERLLAEAIAAYRNALEVRTRKDHPVNWAMSMENLANAHLNIARHPSTNAPEANLRAALEVVNAALTFYDPIHMASDYNTATSLREEIVSALKS